MAKKKANEDAAAAPPRDGQPAVQQPAVQQPAVQQPAVQQPPLEERYADQLAFLRAVDASPRPPGWLLSPERYHRGSYGLWHPPRSAR